MNEVTDVPDRVIERILARVDRSNPDACWLWPGALYGNGYGHVAWQENREQHHLLVHRVMYEALVGPIPGGLDLDHRCHDPAVCIVPAASCPHRRCCNPSHLRPSTRRSNLARGGGPIAAHIAVTHCPYGHEYTPENTRVYRGRRHCRACNPLHNRTAAERRKQRQAAAESQSGSATQAQ